MTDRANTNPFEHVSGLDPATIRDVGDIPDQPFFVEARVGIGAGAGVFKVCDSGQNPTFNITPSGLAIELTQAAETEVVCEPPNYELSTEDPADRVDVTYAGFRLNQARIMRLENGGRLLLPLRMQRSAVSMRPRSHYNSALETGRIHRIVSDLDEARLTITSIATVMGLDQTTSNLVVEQALDFEQFN